MAWRWISSCGVWLLLTATGCDDSKISSDDEANVCVPYSTYTCVNKGTGCTGRQTCLADGSALGECRCEADGTAGVAAGNGGGVAGTNSTAGTGSAGVSAQAGTGSVDEDSGTPTGDEVCDNGKDDDDDGKIDCADKECSELTCVAAAPAGFEGPIALFVGTGAAPKCAGAFGEEAFVAGENPTGAAAACSTCECTPQTSACSAFVNFETGSASGCGGTLCTSSVNSSCVEIEPPCVSGLATAYVKTKLPSAAGTCAPSTVQTTKAAAAFETNVLGCALAGVGSGGCDDDELCAPQDKGSKFQDEVCVWKAGDVACPSTQFTDKRVYSRKITDTRKCSACSCDGPDCGYQWKVFASSDTTCSSPIITLTSENQCVQINPTANKVRVGATLTGTGNCTPEGGDAQGSVTGSDPITVCCEE